METTQEISLHGYSYPAGGELTFINREFEDLVKSVEYLSQDEFNFKQVKYNNPDNTLESLEFINPWSYINFLLHRKTENTGLDFSEESLSPFTNLILDEFNNCTEDQKKRFIKSFLLEYKKDMINPLVHVFQSLLQIEEFLDELVNFELNI